MGYKDLDKDLKVKLSGSMNHHLRHCKLECTDNEIIEEFIYYTLNEEEGSYSYLDKKTFEYIPIKLELKEYLVRELRERLHRKRDKQKVLNS